MGAGVGTHQRALHCLEDFLCSSEAIRDHWFLPVDGPARTNQRISQRAATLEDGSTARARGNQASRLRACAGVHRGRRAGGAWGAARPWSAPCHSISRARLAARAAAKEAKRRAIFHHRGLEDFILSVFPHPTCGAARQEHRHRRASVLRASVWRGTTRARARARGGRAASCGLRPFPPSARRANEVCLLAERPRRWFLAPTFDLDAPHGGKLLPRHADWPGPSAPCEGSPWRSRRTEAAPLSLSAGAGSAATGRAPRRPGAPAPTVRCKGAGLAWSGAGRVDGTGGRADVSRADVCEDACWRAVW